MHTHAHTRTHTDTDTDTHTHKPCAVTSTASKQRRVARGPASLSPRFCRFPRAGHWTTRGGLPAPVHWSNNNFGIFSGLGRHLSDCPRGDLIRVGSCFNFTGPTISTVVTFYLSIVSTAFTCLLAKVFAPAGLALQYCNNWTQHANFLLYWVATPILDSSRSHPGPKSGHDCQSDQNHRFLLQP